MSAFSKTTYAPCALRHPYLATLPEPQEWFLEQRVQAGTVWTHRDQSYGVTYGTTLVEFFSTNPKIAAKRLRDFHDQHRFSSALVKSYDRAFVQSCIELGWTGVVGGFLFRKRVPVPQRAFPSASVYAATPADVPAIWRIDDGFFDGKEEIAELADTQSLWKAVVDGEIVGCGLARRVTSDGDAMDIGMMVAPPRRRNGLGAYIVNFVANHVQGLGLRPICGCGASNAASRATLEKAGFVSQHQLLSFSP